MNDIIMSMYNGSILSIIILIFIIGVIAVKSARSGISRLLIILFTAVSYAALFIGPLQLLSYAKPTSLEWINKDVPEAEVLHAELRENVGIYLLLDWYGTPRYYSIPWNPELAQQLIEAFKKAREDAGNGERPGASSPAEAQDGQGQEQSALDQLLGPVNETDRGDSFESERNGEQATDQGSRGETSNSGNGKVMMRFPFGEQSTREDGELGGDGPGAQYDDARTEAMFYPAPQPKYPEKAAPQSL